MYSWTSSRVSARLRFRMRTWIRKTDSAGGSSSSRFLAFGANSLAFDTPEDLAKVPVSSKPQPGAIDQSGTALASALDHAARSFPPDYVKHLVLLSDGNANSGDIGAALEHLSLENIHVYTRSLGARSGERIRGSRRCWRRHRLRRKNSFRSKFTSTVRAALRRKSKFETARQAPRRSEASG